MRNFFVEIGTCDFDTLLPLAENGWGGICVEPVRAYFDNLPHYDHVIFENSVISDVDGEVPFGYYDASLADAIGHHWVKGVGTTSSQLNHFVVYPQWKSYERHITVNSLTLDSLFRKHNVHSVDFMKVDVEGTEIDIFRNYNWNVKPTMLKVETAHWKAREQLYGVPVEEPFINVLKDNGYIVWLEDDELYAIR